MPCPPVHGATTISLRGSPAGPSPAPAAAVALALLVTVALLLVPVLVPAGCPPALARGTPPGQAPAGERTAAPGGPAGASAGGLAAEALTAVQLAGNPERYDGQVVTLRGEVVGSVMLRGEYGWVNVGDGVAAVGVWAPARTLSAIRFAGGYARRGDTVLVTGLFHQACPRHGGDPDLHASSCEVVERGGRLDLPVPAWKWAMALTLLGAGALLATASWMKQGLRRKS